MFQMREAAVSQRLIWAPNAGDERGREATADHKHNTLLFSQAWPVNEKKEDEEKLMAVFPSGWTRATDVG